MPLVTDPARGPAAEDKDYRPVEGEPLVGDIYRVVSIEPENERWEYPSGSTVFAVKLHSGDEATVIVAPASDPELPPGGGGGGGGGGGPDARRPAPRAQVPGPKLQGAQRPRTPIGPVLPRDGLHGRRTAQIFLMVVIIVTTAFGWLGREIYVYVPLQPADPIRASVVVSCALLIPALWRARGPRELRALTLPCALVGAAFAISLLVGRYAT